jgi:hypothetical protein
MNPIPSGTKVPYQPILPDLQTLVTDRVSGHTSRFVGRNNQLCPVSFLAGINGR